MTREVEDDAIQMPTCDWTELSTTDVLKSCGLSVTPLPLPSRLEDKRRQSGPQIFIKERVYTFF